MAISKNLALHGNWGTTPGQFASASSSPLWTLLLAGVFATFGPGDMAPLVLNLIFGVGLLTTAWFFGRREQWPDFWNFAVLIGIIVLTPLPTLALLGMEHVLQAWSGLALTYLAAELLSRSPPIRSRGLACGLFLAAIVATATRYEGLFLIAAVGLAALLRRRPKLAVWLILAALIPPLVYAVVSVQHGAMWAPNSVLRKGAMPDFHSLRGIADWAGMRGLLVLTQQPHLLGLLCALIAFWLLAAEHRHPSLGKLGWSVFILFVVTLLHLNFAAVGWLFRYESYLMAIGAFSLGLALAIAIPQFNQITGIKQRVIPVALLLAALGVLPAFGRSCVAVRAIPRAATNIYEQQIQMARFIAEFYPNACVALNDIGAVAYFVGPPILDLQGLATTDVLRTHLAKHLSRGRLEELCRDYGVRIAVLYPKVLKEWDGPPPSWQFEGAWTISNNVACADATVQFYAVAPGEGELLGAHLRAFEKQLPPTVKVQIGHSPPS